MRLLIIGAAVAGLVGITAGAQATGKPRDQTSSGQSSATQTPSSSSSATQSPSGSSTASQTSSTQTGTTASSTTELSGVVKDVDKDKRSVKISSPAGTEKEVKIAEGATITRGGTQAGIDQLKEGDQVRVSLDPNGTEATRIEVQSKQMHDKHDQGKKDDKGKSDSGSETKR